MSLEIVPVITKKHFNDFVSLPWELFSTNSNWVPPLRMNVLKQLDTQKNHFYKSAERMLWLAYRDKKPVGRIAGILNHRHNEYHNETTGFWGFFEVINDIEVSEKLFAAVESWAKAKGMTQLRGPVNLSTNHECGLQISAFDTIPYAMMLQHPPYYQQLVESLDHKKAIDLQAWLQKAEDVVDADNTIKQRAANLLKKDGIRLRYIDMKRYNEEIAALYEVYNDAWKKNWGFAPMERDDFLDMAKEMKSIIKPFCIPIIEVENEIAAFAVFIPDINQVLIKIKNGKLFPTGLLKLLWHTKVKKTMNRGRIPLLGVKGKFRHLRLAALLYMELFSSIPANGYPIIESSWILETNRAMVMGLKAVKAFHYKTYRLYEKPL